MNEKRIFKRISALYAAIGIFLLLGVIVGISFTFKTFAKLQQQKEYAQIFVMYKQYGLVYNMKADRLYYNNELVRYFEDIITENYYKKWPNQDGTVDVFAVRDASGTLIGIKTFDKQAFTDRTPYLKDAICELSITESIDEYTSDIENMVEDKIEEAYAIYQPYGLTYDREQGRLYYEGELVGYFEDLKLKHFFGPYYDSTIEVQAVRNSLGNLTGLDVKYGET